MKEEEKIIAPAGYEIEKVELVDGVAVITFKEKKRKLPKTWEEFCEMFPLTDAEYYINKDCDIFSLTSGTRTNRNDRNLLPDRATAEAIIALMQLIRLRDAYNGDWVPDWGKNNSKYVIEFCEGKINKDLNILLAATPLYFKSEELRDEFLRYFRPFIEKLKPLYGIK